ncbi:MAG: CsgG/HfaB family protein [Candidatus Marinimicrobia bacterium]|nr:CsgG/HfaB family protein [Candidatus Neomarinimicrobiota bacterium]
MRSKFVNLTLYCLLIASSAIAQKIAVMDLQPIGSISVSDITILSERFRSQMVQTKTFEVMERNALEALDQELAIQKSDGFVDDPAEADDSDFLASLDQNLKGTGPQQLNIKAIAKAGQKIGAEFVVLGYIGKLQSTYTIDVRLVNCTTSRIDESYSETYKGDIDGLIGLMEKLAKRMAGIEEKSKLWLYLTGGGVVTAATIIYFVLQPEETGLPEPPSPPE